MRFAVLLVAMVLSVYASAVAGAETATPTVRPPTYRVLHDAQRMLEDQQYDEAIARLTKLLPRIEGNGYESALAKQLMAYAHILQDDTDAAIPLLESGMSNDGLPSELLANYVHTLAQLYLRQERYYEAIAMLSSWLEENPDGSAQFHALLGQACYFDEDYGCASVHLSVAIDRSGNPQEFWQQMLLATYYKLEAYHEAKQLLGSLLDRFPQRKKYWLYLSNVELLMEDADAALATLQMAYRQGLLTEEDEVLQLVRLHLYRGNLHTGARILERSSEESLIGNSTDNMRMLANSWLAAREREESVEAIDAALESETDADEIKLLSIYKAEVLLQLERWSEVIALLQPFAEDSESARANLLLGIAAYQDGNSDLSKRALFIASQSDETKGLAEGWLQLLQ